MVVKDFHLSDEETNEVRAATLETLPFISGTPWGIFLGLTVYYMDNADGATIYLTRGQTIELRNYLNQILEETK